MKRIVVVILLLCCLCIDVTAQKILYINEVCVANIDMSIDPSYNYGGWIELYNPSTENVVLKDLRLRHTDSENNVESCVLTGSHGSVEPHGYMVLWFDHNSSDGGYYGANAGLQIPFRLDADGGLIELLNPDMTLIDAVEYPKCIARSSWVRENDGSDTLGWTPEPTPNASNNDCMIATERLDAPVISSEGGVFNDSFQFTVDIPANTTLYYTTDGSTPEVGKSPECTDGVFCDSINKIYRFMLARDGYLNSPVVTRSFLKSEGRFSLPILSVNTAPENFFDDTIGLYVTGTNGRVANGSRVKANLNMDWERPVNVEYFVQNANDNYEKTLNQGANFSLFGGWTRFNNGNNDFEHRTSFKLKSDKIYEDVNSFDYPLFDTKPYIKIKNFLVRNGGQDQDSRLWDAMIQQLLITSGVYLDCQAWQPAHVYLNGKYLGMMNLREESNKQFAFSNYGIDKDDIDQWEGDIVVKEGDRLKLNQWYDLSSQLKGTAADSTTWKSICELVDIDEYCNYMAAETYMGNQDWLRGGFKNIKGFRAKDDDGKFHIVMFDVDGGFGYTDMIRQVLEKGTGSMPVRFKNMLKYEPFKKQFIDAYCIMNGSVFDPERCTPVITEIKNALSPVLKSEGLSPDDKIDLLITRLSDNTERRPALKKSLVSAFSLDDEYTVSLQSNNSQAKILLNGQEIPTGKFNGYMFPPITLSTSAAEGYAFKGWSIDGEIAFTDSVLRLSDEYVSGTYDIEAVYQQIEKKVVPIRINEVSAGNDIFINEYGKKADWIELYNNTDQDYDLAGAYLSDDPLNAHKSMIVSSENVSTTIPAHGYKVVWCDGKEAKTQLHTSFKLKNADKEYISITAADDAWIDSLSYKEQPRWYTYGRFPDGGNNLAMFERPTIDKTNRMCTTTVFEVSDNKIDGIDEIFADDVNSQVIAVKYYNLNGQQIVNIDGERIVIQRVIYRNGSSKSRKIVVGSRL